MNKLIITEIDGYKKEKLRKVSPDDIAKYPKVVKNNTGKKVKISKTEKKGTKVKKSTMALLIAAGASTAAVGILSVIGTREITNDMTASECFADGVYPWDYSDGPRLFSTDSTNRDGSINSDRYFAEVTSKGHEAGYTDDEIYIACQYKYGMDNPYVSSSITSRFLTKVKAGADSISEKLNDDNSRKVSR